MPKKGQTAEMCDATGFHSSYAAGTQKYLY